MKRYKTSGIVCAIAGAATALAMSAGMARADEGTYQSHLAGEGLPTGTTSLQLGHAICSQVTANGVDGVDYEMSLGLANGLTGKQVAAVVFFSAYDLCPSALPAVRAWAALQGNTTEA